MKLKKKNVILFSSHYDVSSQIEKFEQDEKPMKNKHLMVNQNIITTNGKKSKMSSIEEIEKLEKNFIKENKWLPDFKVTEKDLANLTVVSSHNF